MTRLLATSASNPTLKGHKLLLLSPWPLSESDLNAIRAKFPGLSVVYHQLPWSSSAPQTVVEEWKDTTILLTGSTLPTRQQAPRLQYVQLSSAGANQILKNPLFTDTDIVFSTANGVHGPQISEWITASFLALQHKIPHYLDNQRNGHWSSDDEDVQDAVGQTVGIFGYGSIGRQVARILTAAGMTVHAYTLHPRPTPESRRDDSYHPPGLGDPDGTLPSHWYSGSSTQEVHEFLSSGLDMLVIATPLTDLTRHIIGKAEFQLLASKKTFISNIARGAVIDTSALIEALNAGTIRAAALDVTDPEPLPADHPLWRAKNVIITPHVSGSSKNYSKRVLAILDINLGRLGQGRDLMNRVSRRDGY